MHALYAFLRETDDLSDDPNPRLSLPRWREQLDDALGGRYTHRCHAALRNTVERFGIPPEYLHEVITGVEGDLQPVTIRTFDELKTYCYRVAGVVGLACVCIWGLKPGADPAAAMALSVDAGYAFQLTNILRDVGEDRRRGRVYLPADELASFTLDPATWHDGHHADALREVLYFQIDRARGFYQSSAALGELLTPEGANIFRFMCRGYSQLLERIAAAGVDSLDCRARLSRVQKLKLAAGAWANRWRA